MKSFPKIKNWDWIPGTNKVLYESEAGDKYEGPPFECSIGDTLIIEESDGPAEPYHKIIRFLGKIPQKK